jgi:amino acid transporter
MIGVKESALFNKILTLLNLVLLGFVIVAGSLKADPKNWNLNVSNVSNFIQHI